MDKICTKCKEYKPFSAFDKRSDRDTYRSRCRICLNIDSKNYRDNNLEHVKFLHKKHRDKNKDRIKIYNKAFYKANKNYYKDLNLRRRYNLSLKDYNNMLKLQGNRCAICDTIDSKCPKGMLFVDHDHSKDQVRSLLCSQCNHGLGLFYEDPSRLYAAIQYIEKYTGSDLKSP